LTNNNTSTFYRTIELKSLSGHIALPILRLAGYLTRNHSYRGLGLVAKVLGTFLPPASARICLSPDTKVEIDLFDFFWVRLIFDDWYYEPELETFLSRYFAPDYYWIDCGANIGYWSLRLSEHLPPGHVVAIEASPHTFAKLVVNNHMSKDRFAVFNNAVFDCGGKEVPFEISCGHASAHIVSKDQTDDESVETVSVTTVTIDEVVRSLSPKELGALLIVKLDLEGAELAALRGTEVTINGFNTIIIFESHGSDQSCSVARHFLGDGRFNLYSLEGEVTRLSSLEEVRAIQTDPHKGYNFVAVKKSIEPLVTENARYPGTAQESINAAILQAF